MTAIIIAAVLFYTAVSNAQSGNDGYSKIVSASEEKRGLINTYQRGADFYFKLNNKTSAKKFLIIPRPLTIIDNIFFYSGNYLNPYIVQFKKSINGYEVIRHNSAVTPNSKSYFYDRMLKGRYNSLQITASDDEGNDIASVNGFFTQDLEGIADYLKEVFPNSNYFINAAETYVEEIKVFPKNIEVTVNYLFTSDKKNNVDELTHINSFADRRSIQFRMRYSIVDAGGSPGYVPRLYDSRVGYFNNENLIDYNNIYRKENYNRYIKRWHLEKKNKDAEMSEPVKPVVFWIEKSIPKELRETIKTGVLLWNKAFEKIGFRNAIECKEQPDTAAWDPDDIRFNMIKLIPSDSWIGYGPSVSNPYTGEIINSTVFINSEYFIWAKSYFDAVKAVSKLSALLSEKDNSHSNKSLCGCGEIYAQNMLLGLTHLLCTKGENVSEEELAEIWKDDFIWLVSHETGHALGLRHNFKSSSAYTRAEVEDDAFRNEFGLSSSVMDYIPIYIVPPGKIQHEYSTKTIGKYDYFAVEYGYKSFAHIIKPEDELPLIKEIANKSSDKYNIYGSDEDAYDYNSPNSLDPFAQTYDLYDKPLDYFNNYFGTLIFMLGKVDGVFPLKGESYTDFSSIFKTVLSYYFWSFNMIEKFIGGTIVTRMNNIEGQNILPLQPVDKLNQTEALDLINRYLFNIDENVYFNNEVLKKMMPAATYDQLDQSLISRLDFPLDDKILETQKKAINRFYHPVLAKRMLESENLSTEILTYAELNDYLYRNIWREVLEQKEIPKRRRALQKAHLEALITTLVAPQQGMPEEARALAYKTLSKLSDDIRNYTGGDEYVKFHLIDSGNRINKALNSILISK